MNRSFRPLISAASFFLLIAACEGPEGPSGDDGAVGTAGPQGTQGPAGTTSFAGMTDQLTNANIADNSISGAKLTTGTVDGTKITPATITTLEIDTGAVETANLADLAVAAAKLGDLAVTTAKLDDDAVTAAKIADDAVTDAKIANDAVTTDKIDDAAVTEAKIQNGAVTTFKIQSLAITDQQISPTAAISESKVALRGAMFSGRVNALPNAAGTRFGPVSGTSAPLVIRDDAFSLSPSVACASQNLRAYFSGTLAADDAITVIIDEGGVAGLSCSMTGPAGQPTCTSVGTNTIPAGTEISMRYVVTDGNANGIQTGSPTIFFGWECR